jgi:hypothetical protein
MNPQTLEVMDATQYLKNPHRIRSGNRPYFSLPEGLFSDGWAPKHSSYKSFEAFYLSFLAQPPQSLHLRENMYTLASTNRIPWDQVAPEILKELRLLQSGMVYDPQSSCRSATSV